MARGFLYLVAIIDWYSRYMLSWRLSNTLEVGFCVEALEEALKKDQPDILNTDQGAQFTNEAFTCLLEQHGVKVSASPPEPWLPDTGRGILSNPGGSY